MNEYVESTSQGAVTTIAFAHPSQNSLPGHLLAALAEHITKAGADPACKLVVLKSGGDRTFCAGASFTELSSLRDEANGHAFFMGFAKVILAIRSCPKIVIGRVQGKAVGGGVGLAAACDYCYATRHASIRLSELAVGIGPFVIGPAVERKMGLSAFSQLALDAGRWQTADWSCQRGLFAEVYDSIEEMDAAMDMFISDLLQKNDLALQALKQIFWEGTDHWDSLLTERAKTSGRLILTEVAQQAIQAFLQKSN